MIVATTLEEAEAAATDMLSGGRFGSAGARIVVEEFLAGEEASFIVITDGNSMVGTRLRNSGGHHVRIANRLDLLQSSRLDQSVEWAEDLIQEED